MVFISHSTATIGRRRLDVACNSRQQARDVEGSLLFVTLDFTNLYTDMLLAPRLLSRKTRQPNDKKDAPPPPCSCVGISSFPLHAAFAPASKESNEHTTTLDQAPPVVMLSG
ncbi:hypothetical protein LEN26_015399 [Aphanomyces euteiches]|nr:hypothetical protein LEN26_015399 [Aphanomyces euteiches]KAH9105639.1 hypothetical protein AeMF1_018600 [Aphanomyces euteiches]KAH9186561.1 hypothetical protein AeNC1_011466 [Aphanomyces euteiches]